MDTSCTGNNVSFKASEMQVWEDIKKQTQRAALTGGYSFHKPQTFTYKTKVNLFMYRNKSQDDGHN